MHNKTNKYTLSRIADELHDQKNKSGAPGAASLLHEKWMGESSQKLGLEGVQSWLQNGSLEALEARIMLDAAGVITGVDIASDDVTTKQVDAHFSETGDAPATDSDSDDSKAFEEALHGDNASASNEIVFIDARVSHIEQHLNGISSSAEIVLIDPNSDGVEQIAAVLANRENIDAIHIISHGAEGKLYLGVDVLDAASMQGEHLDELTTIGQALSEDGDILIYGCDFTSGEAGLEAAILLGSITGADIAASNDITGAEQRGGDWDLETNVGTIEAAGLVAASWQGILIDTDGDTIDDAVDLDDDNDGIPDLAEGATTTTIPVDSMGFEKTDVDPTYPFFLTAVDGTTEYGDDVEYLGWTTPGTVDWSQGQYIRLSDSSAAITSPAMMPQAPSPAGGGFAVFSVAGEGLTRVLNVTPGETYTITFFIGTAPIYDNIGGIQDGGLLGYTPDLTWGINVGQGAINGEVSFTEADLPVTYTSADFPSTINPGGGTFVSLDPHWQQISFSFTAVGTTATFSIVDEAGLAVTTFDGFTASQTNVVGGIDSDNDGIFDHLDIDSDNDGITDNVEAQSTAGYVPPSGTGSAMTDVNNDGLDDVYGSGLTPVNTDGTDNPDFRDLDSDNDGTNDVDEAGHGISQATIDASGDTDGDGLKDALEGSNNNDGFDVNDENLTGTTFNLADTDGDTNADGSNAVPLNVDFDYRDNLGTANNPPTIDLDENDSSPATGNNYENTFTEGGSAVAIVDTDVAIADADSPTLSSATVLLTNAMPGDRLLINGIAVTNGATGSIGALTYNVTTTATAIQITFTGSATPAEYENALKTITFENTSDDPDTTDRLINITVNDGTSSSAPAVSTIHVVPVNDPPSATADTATTPENTLVNIDVLDNDSDPENDTLTITQIDGMPISVANPTVTLTQGTVTLNPSGGLDFTPTAGFTGPATFTYTIDDANGGTDTATVTVNVTQAGGTNSPPVANPDTTTTPENTPVTIDVIDNDTDPDGHTLTVTHVNGTQIAQGNPPLTVTNGSVTLNASGQLIFTPDAGYTGPATFTYTIDDANGGTDTATVTVNVTQTPTTGVDTDNDGVDDQIDIDDDNDGILDVNEGFNATTTTSYVPINYSPVSGTSVNGSALVGGNTINTTLTATPTTGATTFTNHSPLLDAGNFSVFTTAAGLAGIRSDIVGTFTQTFSSPVTNPILVLTTIGGFGSDDVTRTLQFTDSFVVLDQYNSFWSGGGDPSIVLQVDTNAGTISGSEDGVVIQFQGTFSSITYSINSNSSEQDFFDQAWVLVDSTTTATTQDSDGDGIADHLDIDKDNDGITDNVEAQTTADYIAPSGTGTAMVDADGDGLDDNYDADTASTSSAASLGLSQVDTDGDGTVDTRDADSDNDGILDIAERGDGQPTSLTSTTDTDGDGLVDIFESGTVSDGFDVNDENRTASTIALAGDPQLAADGSNAIPLSLDSNFRDADTDNDGVPDIVDLDDDNDGILDVDEDVAVFTGINTWQYEFYSLPASVAPESTQPITTYHPDFTLNPDGTYSTTATPDLTGTVANGQDPGPGDQGIGQFTSYVSVQPGASISFEYQNGDRWEWVSIAVLDTDGNVLSVLPEYFSSSTNIQTVPAFTAPGNSIVEIVVTIANPGLTYNAPNIASHTVYSDFLFTDSDSDGLIDRLDIDKDNDGITDNVEAQTTADYIAPSGTGTAMVDADGDGLDDNYDADTANTTSAASLGLSQVDTDGDGTVDTLDADSDNDGLTDTDEAGHGVTQAAIDASADTDGDGLKDVVEGADNNDGFDVNDENLDATDTNFLLADSDNDTAADGSNAVPLSHDLDFRDNVSPVFFSPVPVPDNDDEDDGGIGVPPFLGLNAVDDALIIIKTINDFEKLGLGPSELDVDSDLVIIEAVNSMRGLGSVSHISKTTAQPVSAEIGRIKGLRISDTLDAPNGINEGDRIDEAVPTERYQLSEYPVAVGTVVANNETEQPQPAAERSLDVAMQLRSQIGEEAVIIELREKGRSHADSRVGDYRVTLANGQSLPGWLRYTSDGLIIIDRAATTAGPLDIRVQFTVDGEQVVAQAMTIDPVAGQIVRVGEPIPQAAALFSDQLREGRVAN